MPARVTGFAPIARADAKVLVLGTLPSRASLAAGEYYGHPRNAFWLIMRELIGAAGSYESRCRALVENGIAVWDVLQSSVRRGSLDADIRVQTADANDFAEFLRDHRHLQLICFNGRKAHRLFTKFVGQRPALAGFRVEVLPSTSPAYASMPFDAKLARWRTVLESVNWRLGSQVGRNTQ